jgi:predicted proteasome-type protease
MGNIVLFALVGLAVYGMIISMWNDRQENKRMKKDLEQRKVLDSQQVVPTQSQIVQLKTRDLFIDTLTKIGCQYQLGEGEDNRIFFAYQGEHFFADTTNEIMYVHIWDTHWGHVELYDIDEVSRLRKAINTSNLNTAVSTVYTIDEAGSNIDVHSKATIPFISTMPNLEV